MKNRWERINMFRVMTSTDDSELTEVELKAKELYQSMDIMERVRVDFYKVGDTVRTRFRGNKYKYA